MTDDEFNSYLKDRYQDQVDWYDRKAATSQTVYHRMQWAIIILAAVTPVLVVFVLDRELPTALSHLPAVTSAAVAILTAALKTFKYQENWISYRSTCEALRREKHLFDADLNDYRAGSDKERRSVFVERVEDLLASENTAWLKTRKSVSREQDQVEEVDG